MKSYFSKYDFLNRTNSVEEYLPPEYYNNLLKPYTFDGKSDLQIFKKYLKNLKDINNVLEICSGSGRVSDVLLETIPEAYLTVSDLSQRMIDYSKNKFRANEKIKYIQGDAILSALNLEDKYDLVYTLWGFSHSVHQHMHKEGIAKTKELLKTFFRKILTNMNPEGRFYLVHFDSMSDEQRILMRQWKRVYSAFSNLSQQSPSKIALDEILHDLDSRNEIILTVRHLTGDPIVYESENLLMETFLNFHLETYFNTSPLLPTVIEDIREQIKKYRKPDGTFSIATGCYIYEFKKRQYE